MAYTPDHNSNIVSCVVDISILGLPVVDFINHHDEVRIDIFGVKLLNKKINEFLCPMRSGKFEETFYFLNETL